jgi:hypothetical protein
MPFPTLSRPTPSRRCLRLLPLAVTAALGGCEASGDQVPPTCPAVSILGDAADLTRYRGASQDLADMVLSGRITGLSGSCKRTDGGRTVDTTVSVGLELTRGPAAPGRVAATSYFVALTQGETIVAKQVFPLRAVFAPNTDRVRLNGDEVDVPVPNRGKGGAGAYRILVGFELTPAELATNRRRTGR